MKLKTRSEMPHPGQYGAMRLTLLDDDDFAIMKDKLNKYLKARRIFLDGNELWIWEDDAYMKKVFGKEEYTWH